ncbi:MAG: SDR family NAD(P)-dependent oxidoreductase [Gemmatimonadota bacterium]|nr:SDR family NAD(P)-dependent oxidoreductase [Gemmatimonadota bacterium]
MKQIRGKTALVTGASRGIGPHIVRALAEEGMNLVLSARTVSALEQSANVARSLGVRVTCLAADLRRRSDVETLAQRADAEMGGIAVLVNNAGMEGALPYDKVELDAIEEMIALNLTAPMLLTRLLLPAMIRRGEGHVVNISSLAGLVGRRTRRPTPPPSMVSSASREVSTSR